MCCRHAQRCGKHMSHHHTHVTSSHAYHIITHMSPCAKVRQTEIAAARESKVTKATKVSSGIGAERAQAGRVGATHARMMVIAIQRP
jgi:hypothetical protein